MIAHRTPLRQLEARFTERARAAYLVDHGDREDVAQVEMDALAALIERFGIAATPADPDDFVALCTQLEHRAHLDDFLARLLADRRHAVLLAFRAQVENESPPTAYATRAGDKPRPVLDVIGERHAAHAPPRRLFLPVIGRGEALAA